MSKPSLLDIVQVITGIAVVGGLVLLVLELQQAREIASAQQTNEVRTGYDTVTMAEIGEILPSALARACENPTQLTGPDLVALNAYYLSNLMYVLYAYGEEESDVSSRIPWQGYANASFSAIFSTKPGRAWWRDQAGLDWIEIPHEIHKFGDQLLEAAPVTCYLDGWRRAIEQESDV